MNNTSPGRTAWGSSLRVTETIDRLPATSSVVRVKQSPMTSSTGSTARVPMRILGPGRSAMIATGRLTRSAAWRMRRITSPCTRKSPWEKLSRAIFIPASSIFSSISGESEAGPMVQTSLVLQAGRMGVLYMASPCKQWMEYKSTRSRRIKTAGSSRPATGPWRRAAVPRWGWHCPGHRS
jgi:hypothetical protein